MIEWTQLSLVYVKLSLLLAHRPAWTLWLRAQEHIEFVCFKKNLYFFFFYVNTWKCDLYYMLSFMMMHHTYQHLNHTQFFLKSNTLAHVHTIIMATPASKYISSARFLLYHKNIQQEDQIYSHLLNTHARTHVL